MSEVFVVYNHRNRGVHGVRGPATKRDYGYRKSGDRFYVSVEDAEIAPFLFEVIEARNEEPTFPVITRQVIPPPPPVPIFQEEVREEPKEEMPFQQTALDQARFSLDSIPGLSENNIASLKASGFITPSTIMLAGETGLVKVKGIGPTKAKQIIEYISSVYGE